MNPLTLAVYLLCLARAQAAACLVYVDWILHHEVEWGKAANCFVMRKKLRGLSPRANYTDRTTAACRRSYCQLFLKESAAWSEWRIPMAVKSVSRPKKLLFLSRSFQLCSRGWVDPVPDPLLLRKSGSSGNRTQTSGSVARNSAGA
jgi:hypothetical protein